MANRLINIIIDALRYCAYSSVLLIRKRPNITILDDVETVRLIRDEGYSLTRFGDGEFQWIANKSSVSGFQQPSDKLSAALKETYYSDVNKLLIGVPRALVSDSGYNLHAKAFWRGFVSRNADLLSSLFERKRSFYANASITRPYIDYSKNTGSAQRFEMIKSIWNGRNVLIIEGTSTGFGVGNDLLDNAASVKRLEAPSSNAFSRRDDILASALRIAQPNCLILLCLGPTASILAYDLAKVGFQAVDIGHLDLEYEWLLRGAKRKDPIPGKHVNENKNSRPERTTIPESEIVSTID